MDIGTLIKQKRKAAGLTQEALAQKIGCATITIRQYESGKREPSVIVLGKLANALGVDIFDLIPEDPEVTATSSLSQDQIDAIETLSGGDKVLKSVLTIFATLPRETGIQFLENYRNSLRESLSESGENNALNQKKND